MKGTLSCTTLFNTVTNSFGKVKGSKLRAGSISLQDCLLSGYALFSLKYPSLLQFEQHIDEGKMIEYNLKSVYGIEDIPSDTQMRERLDIIEPKQLRRLFTSLLAQCQRSKRLELFKYYGNRYLVPLDGTGYFYSKEVHCNQCCEKHHRDGSIGYYHQILSAAIVHPDQKVVLPFAPEPIMKTDGLSKNDAEHNAGKRFLADLKREHPHLKIIITGDGLYADGPFIKLLKQDGHCFILVAQGKRSINPLLAVLT